MPSVSSVLVVGAGVAGTAVGTLLAEAGVRVDVVEQKEQVSTSGSGITLQGNALRAFDRLGVWEEVKSRGFGFDTLGLRAPDQSGSLIVEMPDARMGGPEFPATLGMPRPALAEILTHRVAAAGAQLRFDTQLTSLTEQDHAVTAGFGDGTVSTYDVVIGADGIHSTTRRLIGIDVEPEPTGMAIWRVFTPRPKSIDRTDLYYGGPAYIAGYCPTGQDSLYAYVVEDADVTNFGLTPTERIVRMRERTSRYHGPWDDIRPFISGDRDINYTLFETHLVPGPWNRGRTVIIGDAAHSCPPTLAQGAAQGLEDALVLAELLVEATTVDDVWPEFQRRRGDRVEEVVAASVQLGTWLMERDPHADVPGLMGRIAARMSVPA